jgi:Ca-activated chloride channel family protein
VAVGLVLDASASMISRQRLAVAGAAAFARSSRSDDEMFTIHFNEQVRFGLPGTVPFTSQASLLQASVAQYRAGGKTAFYDAVIAGLDHLEHASAQKRVLVVLSDGEDNASRHSERDMMDRAGRSNAIVYTVSNANRRVGTAGDPGVLRKLASISGGIAYFPDSEEEIAERFDRIAADIRRGYTIGYVPSAARAPGYRRVKVVVSGPDRRGLDVRSREGYWVSGDVSPQ